MQVFEALEDDSDSDEISSLIKRPPNIHVAIYLLITLTSGNITAYDINLMELDDFFTTLTCILYAKRNEAQINKYYMKKKIGK
jgi:hypothetical protein